MSSHDHRYLSTHHGKHERRTWAVMALTVATMVVEIVSGLLFGSMALLADGWHMASHASAMGITALAFYLARKHQDNPKFTFGTGKIGDLAGFSSAMLLGLIALFMAYESILRLVNPVTIHFNEAIMVAVLGLAVNLLSAFLLKEHHEHHPGEAHSHDDHDHNLRAAYLHVLADALTSILAIAALALGKIWQWNFLDPIMGIVGAAVICRWGYGLLRDTGRVLLDYNHDDTLIRAMQAALKENGNIRINDLHVWRLGPGHHGAIVSVTTDGNTQPEMLKERLHDIEGLSHLTVEVNAEPWPPANVDKKS